MILCFNLRISEAKVSVMKIPRRKSAWLVLAGLICLFGRSELPAQTPGREGLGLREPTLAGRAEVLRKMVPTRKVLPNKLALDRLNAERLAKGLPREFNTPPARMGQEVVTLGDAGQTLLGAGSGGSGATLASLPGRVDNSALSSFPPIRNQGTIGSCASFSSTYTVATHMLGLVRGTNSRNSTDNTTKLSPKFIYTLVNEGVDAGSTIEGNFEALISFGAPSWAAWPYLGEGSNPTNYLEWPRTADVWREAAKNRLYRSGVVANIDTDAGLQTLKAMLANGYLLLFGTDIYGWEFTTFSNDPGTNLDNDLAGKRVCWRVLRNPSGHAMTIVGYDDNVWTDINRNGVVDAGEKGALKIANSWGTSWGDGGFVWIAYDALLDASKVAGANNTGRASGYYSTFYFDEAYWISALEGYTPTLLGEFTVSHASRNQLRLRLGRSTTSASTPQAYSANSDLNGLGGAFAFDGGATEKDGTFVFDFSDLQQSGPQRYYLSMSDVPGGASGQLKSFRLTSSGGTVLASATSGVNAAVDGSTRHAYVDYGGAEAVPSITSATTASGRVGQFFSYTIAATGNATSFGATGLPQGLVLTLNTISGTPTQSGSHNVVLSATNGSGTGTGMLRLEISASLVSKPEITSSSSASGEVGVPFAYLIEATNSPTSYGAEGLPNGLGVNASTGLISGTPTQAGVSAVALSAANDGGSGSRTLTLSISQARASVPEITSLTAVQGVSGSQFLYRIEATNSPTVFGAEGLPAELSLDAATGVITGTLPSPRVYSITLTATNASGTASKTLTLTVTGSAIQGPPNDDFANRVPLAGVSATATGSNVNASLEDGEPTHLGEASHSAWWTWTAPRSAQVVVSLAGSSFDTVLGVYTGGGVAALTPVAVNNDSTASEITSRVVFDAVLGTTYQIAVDGFGQEQGRIALSIVQAAGSAPSNDAFESALLLTGDTATATGSSYDATPQPGEPAHAGQSATRSIWWKWTAPAGGTCTVDTIGSAFDTVLAVYTGSTVSGLSAVASDDQSGGDNASRVVFETTPGTTYHFAVDGNSGAGGAVVLNLSFGAGAKPANDDFASAAPLTGDSATADSSRATAESGEPAHAGNGAAKSLWWTWTAAQNAPVRISTGGSDFDTVLAVYTGSGIHSLVPVAENDDANGTRESQVEFDAVAGTTYRIAVDGYDGESGAVVLAVTQTIAPLNDDFADAQELDTTTDGFASASGSSRRAGAEPGEPSHAGNDASRSLWWQWTAPHSGAVTIDTIGSEFDTVLAVYTGELLAALEEVASNDDFGSDNTSSVTFQAVRGTPYRIALDGYLGRSGRYELALAQMEEGGIYETDFEYFPDGFNALDGFDGWASSDSDPESGTFGIFEAEEGNLAAWIGYNTPTSDTAAISVYRSVEAGMGTGPIEFSVDLWIQDSTNADKRDMFEFGIFNRNGDYLGGLLFDNEDTGIRRYFGEDWDAVEDTGATFKNGVGYTLAATIDLENNTWSATLGDRVLFSNETLTTSQSTRDLGSIPVTWYPGVGGEYGDNFLVFDNYRIATTKRVPVITSAGQRKAVRHGDFVYQIEATHSPDEYGATGLPDELTCDPATGRITGKPASSGTIQVILTAKNSAGTGSKLLLLTVESATADLPEITSTLNASAKAGTNFSYQITATNAPTFYNASVAGGALPAGLAIDSATGILSGTPTTAGTYQIALSAVNGAGSGTAELVLVVGEPTPEPTPQPSGGGSPSSSGGGGGAAQAESSKHSGKAKKKAGGKSKGPKKSSDGNRKDKKSKKSKSGKKKKASKR